ncbi:MAG: hypothetical protein WA688_06335 [Thermoplasmata archaeon]
MAAVVLLVLLPSAATLLAALQEGPPSTGVSLVGAKALWDKPVYFNESGLPHGTTWSVDLSGSNMSSNGTVITFYEVPGTYPFTVAPVAGYSADPSAGNVTVNDCMGTVSVTFTPVRAPSNYTISFDETGLLAGTLWWAHLDGMNSSTSSSTIRFSVANGTYGFTIPDRLSGTAGVQFVSNVSNGTVTVKGANVKVLVPFSTEYFLTMTAQPRGTGTVTPESGWYPAGTSLGISATPTAGYALLEWNGSGTGSYSGTNLNQTITMGSPVRENATFGPAYAVDFQETGLPDGVTWAVTFDNVTQSGFFVYLDFVAVNGTYAYNVTPIPGYHADSYSGPIDVEGSDVNVLIDWARVTYNATFVERGLPGGSPWSVTVNGSEQSAETSTILFVEPNGTYAWTVSPISGYTPNVTGGTLVVHGANVVVQIQWSTAGQPLTPYVITFVEAGLPPSTYWSVTLNGTTSDTQGSATPTIAFLDVPDGSYAYWAPAVDGYHTPYATGAVTVSGENVTVSLPFATLAPTATPPGGSQISVEDLVIFGLIAIGGMIATYLIYRRQ